MSNLGTPTQLLLYFSIVKEDTIWIFDKRLLLFIPLRVKEDTICIFDNSCPYLFNIYTKSADEW